MSNKISVLITEKNKGILTFPEYHIETVAYIGKNGVTTEKKEGDGKTPLGEFELGRILGTPPKEAIDNRGNVQYLQITKDMYWVDDSKSKYYNQLVDITKVRKDWNSAEHLIDYPIQYEYIIEIKTNPHNIPQKGSAIFLHCTKGEPTQGCIAVDRKIMQKLITIVNEQTKIEIHERRELL